MGGGRFLAGGGLILALAIIAAAALIVVTSHASLSSDTDALAKIGMPLGGGTVERVSVVTGPHSTPVGVDVRNQKIWPRQLIPAHQLVSIEVVIKRPGATGWLAGSTERVRLRLMTPSASLAEHYITLRPGTPLLLRFKQPVRVIAVGDPGHLSRRILAKPLTVVNVHRSADAGTTYVAAAPRTWESSQPSVVSWFPAGAATAAVATPAPGAQLMPQTNIALTFSKPISSVLGSSQPPVSPATPGTWHTVNSHTMVFEPQGYGYGLGAKVSVALPSGVQLIGGQRSGNSEVGTWTVPGGSTLRLQQLLAQLGYLPVRFNQAGASVAQTPAAQEAAAIHPPAGNFSWIYPNVPSALHGFWSPGSSGVMTQGALMSFQNDHGLTTDGVAGASVWRSLINAADAGNRSSFGYTFASVSLNGQSLNLWHNGRTVLTTPVNTGISSAPTASGTYPVYEHIRVGTMSGTNPDGSHYDDPGIQFISYFNGGDALHAFTRAQYGFPQSLGCVEMALDPAGQVWPYTPIGTLVHVA